MKLSTLTVDSARATEGAWVKGLPGSDDLALKVRGYAYEPYALMVAAEASKVGPEGRAEGRPDGSIKRSVMDKITGRAMAAHILIDWANLKDDDGKDVPYDLEKAILYLTHPDYRPFNAFVDMAAQEVERKDSTRVTASLGNSSPASGIS
jgi:hypothetical protein